MKVTLVQIIEFHGEGFTHHMKRVKQDVVSVAALEFIQPHSFEDWNQIRLRIPPVCASTTNLTSKIIAVSYEVVLTFEAVGFHVSKNLTIPIVIGTVPLVDTSAATSASTSAAISSEYSTIQPPPPYSYQASVFGPTGEDDLPPDYDEIVGEVCDSNAKTFTPYYPYFGELST